MSRLTVRPDGTIELEGVFAASWPFAVVLDGGAPSVIVRRVSANTMVADADGASLEWRATALAGSGRVWELGLSVANARAAHLRVSRADPLAATLFYTDWQYLHFSSGWGAEFEPSRGPVAGGLDLDTRAGRSSHGRHPWLGLERAGRALIVAPAWSGNWHITVDAAGTLTAGISPWQFAADLAPGERFDAPTVIIAIGDDLEHAALALTRAVATDLVPRSPASEALAVEWNHWWPYEDAEIDERTFLANADRAGGLGIEVCTLDAGWFGRPEPDSSWPEERGDWAMVNTARFPNGLASLAAGVRERGMTFGVWLEPEAVGARARLRSDEPGIMAVRAAPGGSDPSYQTMTVSLDPDDPRFLGYVCLGSPAGRAHVAGALDALVSETEAGWVKLDFNVDPGAGCDRTDHGHGAHDGLLRHYEGLYRMLDDFREAHPGVVLEACSSGGLRLDLGLLRHVHCAFLSDPDYTEHHLQVLWGASLMVPPVAMLHWSWSQWRGSHEGQGIDIAALTPEAFDTTLRAAMLQRFGVSLRLPELPVALADRLAVHVALFREVLAPLVRDGTLRRLTAQPLRHGRGERLSVWQLSLGDRHVLLAVALPGAKPDAVRPIALAPGLWRATPLAISDTQPIEGDGAGFERDGIPLHGARDFTSWLWLLEPVGGASVAGR